MRPLALCPVVLLCACAGPDRRGEAGPAGPPPGPRLPRSSVAAVILKAERLGLDAAQVDALRVIDDALARRLEAELPRPAGTDGQRPPSEGGSASGIAEAGGRGRGGPPGGAGGGMGGPPGGGMGVPPGGGHGGGPGAGPGGGKAAGSDTDLEARLDELDTRAFLRAEAVLRPEQRDGAREIASDYRAQRYDLRQARKKRR